MRFIYDDQVVKAIPPDTSNEPLHIAILPRSTIRGQDQSDTKSFNTLRESLAEHTVAIPYQELEWLFVTERVPQLLGGTIRSGMLRHVEVYDLQLELGS